MPHSKKIDKAGERLKQKILGEIHQTSKKWKGTRTHRIRRNQVKIPDAIRKAVNVTGGQFGCHTCLTLIKNDRNQPWIGDHIPPTQLKQSARTHYGCSVNTVLFPQCDDCASAQSTLVRRLNSCKGQFPMLTPRQKKLIKGGMSLNKSIPATGPKVTQGQGLIIQSLGVRNGCHSCGREYPKTTYHSDHVFPQEFVTSYMPQVFQLLGITVPDFNNLEVRPQCPRCSNRQGGKVGRIAIMAREYARNNGIVVYKY